MPHFPKEMSPQELDHLSSLPTDERINYYDTILKAYSKYLEDTRQAKEKLTDTIDNLFKHWPDPPYDSNVS